MKVLTLILMVAITMALSITVAIKSTADKEEKLYFDPIESTTPTTLSPDEPFPLQENARMPSKRVSRFLVQQNTAPLRTYLNNVCQKNQLTCVSVNTAGHTKNSTCCNMRCVHLQSDRKNCGSCGKLCPFPKVCCGGVCVNIVNDVNHCGQCRNECPHGVACKYSMCDYA
ncbi:hypothetical protein RHSIM_RhsimUnG0248700 [Rhododendron simsii]|uniref:Stigma-specific STIG1-like protein 1 n=1 Tax=Rhododendron simsii TaxID=118357 RepID=A0A834FTA2_RHOSS|nr:hypothetical protein RHSIM_RhsimUnG0248700 [Rhododendron simsii]